jgi:hypothetical protein
MEMDREFGKICCTLQDYVMNYIMFGTQSVLFGNEIRSDFE